MYCCSACWPASTKSLIAHAKAPLQIQRLSVPSNTGMILLLDYSLDPPTRNRCQLLVYSVSNAYYLVVTPSLQKLGYSLIDNGTVGFIVRSTASEYDLSIHFFSVLQKVSLVFLSEASFFIGYSALGCGRWFAKFCVCVLPGTLYSLER